MTICIVAKCEGGIIFGAADRMKTALDVEFEPPTPKIFPLTTSIVAMTSGDSTFQAEILRDLYAIVNERINEDPKNWWKVKDVAELYAYLRNLAKSKRAANSILTPLGLNHENFINRQKEMKASFITSITQAILNFNVPMVSAIITGIDTDGSHIYVINNDEVRCWNTIAFASIGSGSHHAESQFMLSRHGWNSPLSESLLLTYIAKKRSEIAPGVGNHTDMFMIGPLLGSYTPINLQVIEKLENEYQKIIEQEAKIQATARIEIRRYVEELQEEANKAAAEQAQKSSGLDNEQSTGSSSIQVDTEISVT